MYERVDQELLNLDTLLYITTIYHYEKVAD